MHSASTLHPVPSFNNYLIIFHLDPLLTSQRVEMIAIIMVAC